MASSLQIVRSLEMGIFFPVNLIGNLLVIIVIKRTKKDLRTPMNYLLGNLAVADITVAFFMVVDQVFFDTANHPGGLTGDYLCKLLTGKTLSWVGSVASVCTLLAIAFERFYAIVLPYHRRERITKKKVGVLVASCWVFAFFFNAPLFVVRKFNDDPGTGFFCRSSWPDNRLGLSYNYLWLMFVGVIPICVMVLFYGKIVHNLWHSERQAVHGAQLARLNSRKRVTKILVTLNIIYAFCWFPNLLINVIVYYIANPKLYSIGYLVTELLVLLNSSINPFVYALQSKQFRIAVKNIFCCRKRVEVRPLATFDTRAADSSTRSVNMSHFTQS